jgi:hypothetical protein
MEKRWVSEEGKRCCHFLMNWRSLMDYSSSGRGKTLMNMWGFGMGEPALSDAMRPQF